MKIEMVITAAHKVFMTSINYPIFFLFLCVVNTAWAADQQYCQRYASTSVHQYDVAIKEGVPNITFPVWSNDYNGHFVWCLTVAEQEAQNGITQRDQIIKQNRTSNPANSAGAITGMSVVSKSPNEVVFDVIYNFDSYNPAQGNLTMGGWLYNQGQKFGAHSAVNVYNPIGTGRVVLKINSWDPKTSDQVEFFLYQGNQLVAERKFYYKLDAIPYR